jgi:hypothetical protein
MFAQAIRTASQFTYPYVGLRRQACGQAYSTIAAFVVVNDEGWALTSGHVVEEILAIGREVPDVDVPAEGEPGAENACIDHIEIWALPGFEGVRVGIAEAVIRPLSDLALVKLDPFDAAWIAEYPQLRDPDKHPVEQGMSVCRLGYPFHNIQATWDEERHEFSLPPGSFPVPSFALDGVVARFQLILAEDGSGSATFIETSTPGLRGQSGGPLFDAEGRVCGIQSRTIHLDLGFDARFSANGQTVTERQFLNVGAATHVTDVMSLLDEAQVAYRVG